MEVAEDSQRLREVVGNVYYGKEKSFNHWFDNLFGKPGEHADILKQFTDRSLSTKDREASMPGVELMRPVVKLAKIFGRRDQGCHKHEFVNFGHCGNGDRIEFYSAAYQHHIRTHGDGECSIESFD